MDILIIKVLNIGLKTLRFTKQFPLKYFVDMKKI
jgi:hypothetical protein